MSRLHSPSSLFLTRSVKGQGSLQDRGTRPRGLLDYLEMPKKFFAVIRHADIQRYQRFSFADGPGNSGHAFALEKTSIRSDRGAFSASCLSCSGSPIPTGHPFLITALACAALDMRALTRGTTRGPTLGNAPTWMPHSQSSYSRNAETSEDSKASILTCL